MMIDGQIGQSHVVPVARARRSTLVPDGMIVTTGGYGGQLLAIVVGVDERRTPAQEEAVRIVRAGMRDVLRWLGEDHRTGRQVWDDILSLKGRAP